MAEGSPKVYNLGRFPTRSLVTFPIGHCKIRTPAYDARSRKARKLLGNRIRVMQTKRLLFRSFLMLDRAGLHVIPKHYYTPVPDMKWLETNRPLWMGRSSLTGIAWDLDAQLNWLKDACAPFYCEVAGLEAYKSFMRDGWGPGYGEIESQILHCVVRRHAPPQIIEIGSGTSTMCMLTAARLNERDGKHASRITCVEPFPSDKLRSLKHVELIKKFCQEIALPLFNGLEEGDLLFIDSSHAVKVGSDVQRIYLEIIPHLRPGVFVQIHDIYLPYAYPRDVFAMPFWWQETALLTALLVNNAKISVLTCLSALHYDRTDQLQEILPDYWPAANVEGLEASPTTSGHFPASIWLRTS